MTKRPALFSVTMYKSKSDGEFVWDPGEEDLKVKSLFGVVMQEADRRSNPRIGKPTYLD